MTIRLIETFARRLGQAGIATLLVYAAWNYGGVTPTSVRDVAIGTLVCLLLTTVSILLRQRSQPLSPMFPLIASAFILYGLIQGTHWQRDGIELISPSHALASQSIDSIELSVSRLAVSERDERVPTTIDSMVNVPTKRVREGGSISVDLHRTRWSIIPLVSAFGIFVSSSLLFVTPRSRHGLAAVIVANAFALTFWGFVQRSAGNECILPGVPYISGGVPFASFIYKNAGAAWLVPGLAIIVVVLYQRLASDHPFASQGRLQVLQRDPPRHRQPGSYLDVLKVRNLALIAIGLFLIAGLVASLCRGVWASITIACVCAYLCTGKVRVTRVGVLNIAIGISLVGLIIFLAGTGRKVQERAVDLSVQRVFTDTRWDHWPDGWDTAIASFPWGSGLGTYRFATLPHHRMDHRSWFQHAHNQYLETFTEMGLIGFVLLLVGLVCLMRALLQSQREPESLDARRWSAVAIVVLVSGSLQSIIDFVLIIPANTCLYAVIVGMALSCPRKQSGVAREQNSVPIFWNLPLANLQWLAISILLSLVTVTYARQECFSEQTLNETSITNVTSIPGKNRLLTAIAKLDFAIDQQPLNAALRKRRSDWHWLLARSEILTIAQSTGSPVRWENTKPENMFVLMRSASQKERDQLRKTLLESQGFRDAFQRTLSDLSDALALQPHLPSYYLSAAFLSPLAELSTDVFIRPASQLAGNSNDLLYSIGLVAHYSEQPQLAVEMWERSLKLHLEHLDSIFAYSVTSLSPQQVAGRIVPPQRMDLVLRLMSGAGDLPESASRQLGEQLVSVLESRQDLNPAEKQAWIARVHQCSGKQAEAALAWRRAVEADGRNADYRYQLAECLQTLGRESEAVDQALLGRAINRDDARFDKLIGVLRTNMQATSEGIRPVSHHPFQSRQSL